MLAKGKRNAQDQRKKLVLGVIMAYVKVKNRIKSEILFGNCQRE